MNCRKLRPPLRRRVRILTPVLLLIPVLGPAQPAPVEPPPDETVVLSPFEVTSSSDIGYAATETLDGTRLRTSLRSVGAAMTILTPEFLQDVAATSFEEALQYVPNTDSYGGGQITNPEGPTTRELNGYSVRGFRNDSLSQDFFPMLYRPDLYNIERLTFSRGPNSILFGIGNPAGVTNSMSKRAVFTPVREIGLRMDSEGSLRATLDFNAPLIPDRLAFRVAAVNDDGRTWREPEHSRTRRAYLAFTLNPLRDSARRADRLQVAGSYERGTTDWLKGRNEPVFDAVTPWIEAGRPTVSTIGATTAGNAPPGLAVVNGNAWLIVSQFSPLPGSATPNLSWRRMAATAQPTTATADRSRNASVLDQGIFPFDANYLGGAQSYDDSFDTLRFTVSRGFLDRLHIQAAYNYQDYRQNSYEEMRGTVLQADPNRFLPNGAPNPNLGRYYMDGVILRNSPHRRWQVETGRLTASYRLDMKEVFDGALRHLGRLQVAAMLERQLSENIAPLTQLSNVTPALTNSRQGLSGAAAFPADITAAQNRAHLRHYLDPTAGVSSAPRVSNRVPWELYAGDPLPAQAADAGGVTLALIADSSGSNSRQQLDSRMLAFQHSLLQDRVFTTVGWRVDDQRTWNAGDQIEAARDPVTRLYPDPHRFDARNSPTSLVRDRGTPRSFGVVAYPLPWLGLFYNRADNFQPGGVQLDLAGQPHPGQTGVGKDYGVKVFLFDQRLVATVSFFDTSLENQLSGFIRTGASGMLANNFQTSIDELWETVAAITGDRKYTTHPYRSPATWNGRQSFSSEGFEFQLAWNPSERWRVAWNVSHQKGVYSEAGPEVGAYINRFIPAEILPAWNAAPLNNPPTYLADKTVGGMVRLLQQDYARLASLVGTADTRQPLYSSNLTATHTFAKASRLAGFAVGGTVKWRGDRYLGFPFRADGISLDSAHPFEGGGSTLVDVMLRYRGRAWRNITWTVQLNVQNVLDDTDLVPLQIDGDRKGAIVRWGFQTPRTFLLGTTIRF